MENPVSWSALQELDTERTQAFLERTAGLVSEAYSDHSLPEDLVQEAWAWIGENPLRTSRWWFTADDGKNKFSWRRFRQDVLDVMHRTARRDRLAAEGLEEDDQVVYGRKMVERHLPYVWHSEVLAAVGEVNEIRSKTDPALGGDSLASAVDVRSAFGAVIASEGPSLLHKAMFLTYALGWTQDEIGEELELDRRRVGELLRTGVDRISERLSGPRLQPGKTLGDGPGTRPAVSKRIE